MISSPGSSGKTSPVSPGHCPPSFVSQRAHGPSRSRSFAKWSSSGLAMERRQGLCRQNPRRTNYSGPRPHSPLRLPRRHGPHSAHVSRVRARGTGRRSEHGSRYGAPSCRLLACRSSVPRSCFSFTALDMDSAIDSRYAGFLEPSTWLEAIRQFLEIDDETDPSGLRHG